MNDLLNLLRHARGSYGWLLLAIVLAAGTVMAAVGLMATAAYVIAGAAVFSSVADLAVAIVGVRFFGLSRGLVRYGERYISHRATFRLLAALRVRCYHALAALPLASLRFNRSGELLTRLVADVETLEQFYLRVLAPYGAAALVLLLVTGWLGLLAPQLAVIFAASAFFCAVVWPLLARGLACSPARQLARWRGRYGALLVDYLQGLADLTVFNAQDEPRRQLNDAAAGWRRAERRLTVLETLQGTVADLVAYGAVWLMLLAGVVLVSGGQLAGILLPVALLAALAAFEAFLPLPVAMNNLAVSTAASGRIEEFLRPARAGVVATVSAPEATAADRRQLLWLSGVCFSHAGAQTPTLSDVELSLERGQLKVLVGASGAGKSSLLNLVLGYHPYIGSVRLQGEELSEMGAERARELFSVSPQRAHLFNESVAANLRLGAADAGDDELWRMLAAVGLEELVRGLPQGLETRVGEFGLQLSAGERQRLALARALLRPAPGLLLDEVTANLDAANQQAVWQLVLQERRSRGILVVSHDLIGLAQADEILLLDGGYIIERGRHDELVSKAGAYYELWRRQAELLPDDWL